MYKKIMATLALSACGMIHAATGGAGADPVSVNASLAGLTGEQVAYTVHMEVLRHMLTTNDKLKRIAGVLRGMHRLRAEKKEFFMQKGAMDEAAPEVAVLSALANMESVKLNFKEDALMGIEVVDRKEISGLHLLTYAERAATAVVYCDCDPSDIIHDGYFNNFVVVAAKALLKANAEGARVEEDYSFDGPVPTLGGLRIVDWRDGEEKALHPVAFVKAKLYLPHCHYSADHNLLVVTKSAEKPSGEMFAAVSEFASKEAEA